MKIALILFAHGARDPEWANPMRRVQSAIRQRLGEVPVELAFLEFMSPNLPDCAEQLIRLGAQRIVVLPMFIARGGHLKREVPEMMETLHRLHPGVEFTLAGAIGEHDQVIQAMAGAALEVSGLGLA